MKLTQLNAVIFHKASVIDINDYLQAFTDCYERYSPIDDLTQRQQKIETCISKWKSMYKWMQDGGKEGYINWMGLAGNPVKL